METQNRHYCCICSNYRGKQVNNAKISLHRFPVASCRRQSWIRRLKIVSAGYFFSEHDRLCSFHFMTTPCTGVPSRFILRDGTLKIFKNEQHGWSTDFDVQPTQDNYSQGLKDTGEDDSGMDIQHGPSCPLEAPDDLMASLTMHNYGFHETLLPPSRNKESQTSSACVSSVSIGTQTVESSFDNKNTHCQTDHVVMKNTAVQCNRPTFTYEDICKDNEKVMFYTGIPESKMFDIMFDEIHADAKSQTGRSTDQAVSESEGRPRKLRLIDEFFLVLMRLRLGLLLEDLADRFDISVATCSLIFNKWVDFLSQKLSVLIQWPTRDSMKATMPYEFLRRFPSCRVIIDCTEIYAETPSSLQNKSLLYSNYKSHMTFKALVGISPAGVTIFASDLWSGGISDKRITKECGILDLLEEGDSVMADKGFVISDLTTERGIGLIIPPFKRKKRRLSKEEVRNTRDIANLRIHVERQMERIKNFHIFDGVMKISMVSQASKIWKICTCLTNLLPPLCHVPSFEIEV